MKLDGNYWRRHARQPVEFAKSVRTLADLGCKVLLEIGPQPVLTAAAMRAWPDPATAPRAIASLRREHRRPPTDHRSPCRRVRSGPSARLRRCPAGTGAKARPAHLSVPASPVLVSRTIGSAAHPAIHMVAAAHRSRPASRGRPDRGTRAPTRRWRAVIDQTLNVLTKLAAQHNQQRKTQSIADDALRVPLGEIHRDGLRLRKPARRLPGCSSALMPMRSSRWSTR